MTLMMRKHICYAVETVHPRTNRSNADQFMKTFSLGYLNISDTAIKALIFLEEFNRSKLPTLLFCENSLTK
jgi:hypothetical protein